MTEPREPAAELLANLRARVDSPAELMPLVYAELRQLANGMMRAERSDHTLQPTALVHELFVRLVDSEAALGKGRREFLAVAARAMRWSPFRWRKPSRPTASSGPPPGAPWRTADRQRAPRRGRRRGHCHGAVDIAFVTSPFRATTQRENPP